MGYSVKILEQTDDTIRVGGYGVVFGGLDLDGETFTKDTDFMLDLVPKKPVLYDHATNPDVQKSVLGFIDGSAIKMDDTGIWVEAELDRHNAYIDRITALIEKGALGWSSGTIPQLATRDGKHIKQWAVIEWSLTPTPAEPRTVGVERIKSLISQLPALADLLPEVPEDGTATDGIAEKSNSSLEGENMSEQQTQQPQAVDLSPVLEAIKAQGEQVAALNDRIKAFEATPVNDTKTSKAPAVISERGDSEAKAFKAFAQGRNGTEFEVKASNATDMNIGTAADGGNLVPTGFYDQIIARRDQTMLAARLPIMRIPGVGTTVDVPIDNEADGEFVSTAEAATFDLDAPAVGKKSLTLAKYTKYVDVSYELLDDTPTALEAFLANFVGRGMAKTHNNLLLTEVGSNGTSFKTFASASAIAFGEPEDIVGNNDLAPYLDDESATAWVTRSSTFWDIKSIVGNDRQYAINSDSGRTLLGYPVYTSDKAAAYATNAKTIYFGNWSYVGMREAPGLTFIRDPYTVAVSGQVRLLWHFRTVYGVLQSEAIGYGQMAAS